MERMFNCDEAALLHAMHDSILYRIIKHNNHVRIPGDNPLDLSDYVKDVPTNEWEILDHDGVNIYTNQEYVVRARVEPQVRIEHAGDVFIFEDSNYDDPATHPYGVLAMAGKSISKKYLIHNFPAYISIETDSEGHREKYTWKE